MPSTRKCLAVDSEPASGVAEANFLVYNFSAMKTPYPVCQISQLLNPLTPGTHSRAIPECYPISNCPSRRPPADLQPAA